MRCVIAGARPEHVSGEARQCVCSASLHEFLQVLGVLPAEEPASDEGD